MRNLINEKIDTLGSLEILKGQLMQANRFTLVEIIEERILSLKIEIQDLLKGFATSEDL